MEQFNFKGSVVGGPSFFDIDGDGKKEILVAELIDEQVFLNIRDLTDQERYRFPAVTKDEFTNRKYDWYCCLEFAGITDVNNDGRKDIICTVFTPLAGSPRGVYAFDYISGKPIWRYQMGAAPGPAHILDINQDGVPELLFATAATRNNRKPINGTYDLQLFYHSGYQGQKVALSNCWSILRYDICAVGRGSEWRSLSRIYCGWQ